ncbi:hypothetical protein PQ469_06020 [Mucilaginibacter sp. KACC 22773]|uniref:hypothetical protein n=1 Tax=Mucilaginibacter sp. KACC 22773 TaxID=3025671 RepID=UPI002366EA51|nr:hypothetical protein [Mucilaginibacter sp. KACC 22773]WDF79559.1 hypothetical protein PQ469_06020 [Mucilaginibacter sp. KACC 22773]
MRASQSTLKKLGIETQHNPEEFIKNFIDYIPKRLDVAVYMENQGEIQSLCCHLDFIDFHFRRYVADRKKTLHRVFFEVREYLQKGYPGESINELIKDIRDIALECEFYELIPRLDKSTKKIEKLIEIYRLYSYNTYL